MNVCELRGGDGCSRERYVVGETEVIRLINEALAARPSVTPAQVTPQDLQQAIAAIKIPVASTAKPKGVSDESAQGTDNMKFEPAGHTHASKARKARVAVNTATYVWTYPIPFDAGVVPICNGIAETAAGSTDLINVQVEGTPTNTQCKFRITRVSSGLLSLLLGALSINPQPAAITLAMSALEP